jgi:hypothetical protein
MFPVYGGKCLSCKVIHNWVEQFSQEHLKVVDDARPGSPVEIVKEATVQQVEELVQADRRITIDSVATALGCTHDLAYGIMHDHLMFWKVCAWWLPRELKDREKRNQMGLSLQHLLRYEYADGEDMFNRTVTGDESWLHHYQPKSKCTSMQLKHSSSPSTKKFKVMPSAGKVMLTMFWDSQGILLAHFQMCGANVNSALYCEVLLKLLDAICRNIQASWQKGYCFIMTMPDPIQPE